MSSALSSLHSRPRLRSAIQLIRRLKLAWLLIRTPNSTVIPVSYEYTVKGSPVGYTIDLRSVR